MLAFVEASHIWFAEAGVEWPLASGGEGIRNRVKGVQTGTVGNRTSTPESAPADQGTASPRQTRLGLALDPARTGGSVASDDTELFKGIEENELSDLDALEVWNHVSVPRV